MTDTDIIIVGGGTVGSLLARGLLAKTDYRIALVDANSFTADQTHPGFDARVIALAKRTVDELGAISVDLSAIQSTPIHHIQVSEQGGAGLCQLHADEFGLTAFGRVVSLTELGKALQPDAHPALTVFAPASVTSVERERESVSVVLSNGEQLNARLLILADGGRSPLARQLGLGSRVEDYQQTAIIANVQMSQPHHHWAYERFTPSGPLAFLPLTMTDTARGATSHNGFSMVWTVPPEEAQQLGQCSESEFIGRLQQAFGYRHGLIEQVGPRTQYPLALRTTQPAVAHRTLAVGNAAQTLHPIAGQGFNLGLRDVVTLVEALANQPDPGAFSVLHRYGQRRQDDRQATISLTDTLVRLFSNRHWPLQAARNLGLIGLENLPLAKRRFVRQTTGFGPKA